MRSLEILEKMYLCTIQLQKIFQKVSYYFRLFIAIFRFWGFSFIKRLILGILTWNFNTILVVRYSNYVLNILKIGRYFWKTVKIIFVFFSTYIDNYTEAPLRIVFIECNHCIQIKYYNNTLSCPRTEETMDKHPTPLTYPFFFTCFLFTCIFFLFFADQRNRRENT